MTATVIALHTGKPTARRIPPDESHQTMLVELRRARIRIAQLEASLTKAMRDNLNNFNRAREAERKLEHVLSELKETGTP
jgi:hypothetical protein